jgi:hypothetical protein
MDEELVPSAWFGRIRRLRSSRPDRWYRRSVHGRRNLVADEVGGTPLRIGIEMGIPRTRGGLSVAQQLTDYGKA